MPCFFASCDPFYEGIRAISCLAFIYLGHQLVDVLVLRQLVSSLTTLRLVSAPQHGIRESLWKLIVLTALISSGMAVLLDSPALPTTTSSGNWYQLDSTDFMRWYYMLYMAFLVHTIRSGNWDHTMGTFAHQCLTGLLLLLSYAFDATHLGLFGLLLHEVSDWLYEAFAVFVHVAWPIASAISLSLISLAAVVVKHGILLSIISNVRRTQGEEETCLYDASRITIMSIDPAKTMVVYWGFVALVAGLVVVHVVRAYRMIMSALSILQQRKRTPATPTKTD